MIKLCYIRHFVQFTRSLHRLLVLHTPLEVLTACQVNPCPWQIEGAPAESSFLSCQNSPGQPCLAGCRHRAYCIDHIELTGLICYPLPAHAGPALALPPHHHLQVQAAIIIAIKKRTMLTMYLFLQARGDEGTVWQIRGCSACTSVWQPHVMQSDLVQAGPERSCRHPASYRQPPPPPPPPVHADCPAGNTYCSKNINVLRVLCLMLEQQFHQRCRLASTCKIATVCTCRVSN